MANIRNRLSSISRILTRVGFSFLAILIAALCLTSYVSAENIYQTKSMEAGKYWGDTGYWSGAIPSTSTTNNYFVGQGATDSITFRTKDQVNTANSSDTFPNGNTLWLGYNTNGTFSSALGQMALKSWNFTINDLQLGNSLINQAMKDGTANMKGAMTVNGTVTFQFSNAAGRKINVQSPISGDGEITLWENSNNENLTISSANNAFTGTLNVSQNSSVVLSGANAMQNASSIVLNTGSTLKLSAAQTFVENSITGSGTLKIAADQSSSANETALYGISDSFTGTINVTNTARGYYSKPLSENVKLVIDEGAQFSIFYTTDVEIASDISLTCYGKKIQSANAGGLVFHELHEPVSVTGKITLGANSMIGVYSRVDNAQLVGDIETNGYLLEFRQTRDATDTATITILGDVLASGGSLGRIQLAHDTGSKMTTYLRIGDASAADEYAPTIQEINANVINKNKNEIIFQPGANRTVTVTGTMSNDSSGGNTKGYIKESDGTLVLTGGLTTQMTVNAGVFEITDSAFENITGKITVGDNGTLELNVAEGQPKTLTLSAQNSVVSSGKVIKTGEGELKIDAAAGAVDVYSLVVSSGRLDMKTYFKGSLEIGEEIGVNDYTTATFSPGNSVGTLNINGSFALNPGSTLLMEIGTNESGEAVADQLIVNGNIDIRENSVILLTLDENSSLAPNTSFTVDLISGSGVTEDTLVAVQDRISSYYFTDIDVALNGGVIQLTARLDANAVPEPSTWALLVLGVIALFLRKRVRN